MNLKQRCVIFGPTLTLLSFVMILLLQAREQFSGEWEVEGWSGGVSRNMNDYISEILPPHIIPKHFCRQDDERVLLVMISSEPKHFRLRQAIRQTWGQKNDNASFFFLVGEVPNKHLQQILEVESSRYDDIIQERFLDSYNNLTIKSAVMLKLFSSRCIDSYRFLLKADDDVLLNIPSIVKMLAWRPKHTKEIIGRAREGVGPFRNRNSKWYISREWYPNNTYPNFLCGPSYIMSADAVVKIYERVLDTPLIHIEDVFITGICADVDLRVENNYYFTCDRLNNHVCNYKNLYSMHYYTEEEMRKNYEILKSDYCEDYRDVNALELWLFFFYIYV